MNPGVMCAFRGLAASGLVAALSVAAVPAQAADPPPAPGPAGTTAPKLAAGETYVFGSANDTSTKRKKLSVGLSAGNGRLSISLRQGSEGHSWGFEMPNNDLSINRKGAGTLRTRATGPYGKVSLKIVPVKAWDVERCRGKVTSKSRAVTLKGAFFFDSKGSWGAVGSRTRFALKGTVTRILASSDCFDTVCPSVGGSWSAFGGDAFLGGSWRPGADRASIFGSRTVSLPKPRGASRSDYRSVNVPAPELVPGDGDTAELRVRGGGAVKGSATLSGEFGSPFETTCGGDTYTTTSWSAEFTNGGTPLTVQMSAFSDIKVPNGSSGSFSRTLKN